MGELIEVGIISQHKRIYSKMLELLEKHLKMKNTAQIINVMDNWQYDNMIEINSIEEAENYMESKIVTIEKRSSCNQVGVSVEKKQKGYIVECWINPYKEIVDIVYNEFVNKIIKYFETNNIIDVCGVGKEVSVDYDKSIYTLIKDSHNIDLWIISQQIYSTNQLNELNIKSVII